LAISRSGIRTTLRQIERAVLRAAPPAVDAGLNVLRDAVEVRTPIGETGALRDGIAVERARATKGGAAGAVSVTADHVASVEFGDSDQPARPFLRPAADLDGDRAAAAVERELMRGLR
jgi:HK97 gp10 family phage protein